MARFTTWLFHYWQSFMTWLDALTFEAMKAKLYHWQTFAAGLVAVVAAIITVGGGEVFARCRERRERKAILLSRSTCSSEGERCSYGRMRGA
jgi:hypothetical protein